MLTRLRAVRQTSGGSFVPEKSSHSVSGLFGRLLDVNRLHLLDDGVSKIGCPRFAAHVARQLIARAVHPFECVPDSQRSFGFADVPQHQKRGTKESGGIRKIPARDVRC